MGGLAWKALATVSALVAGAVATKAVDAAWKATGREPVSNPMSSDAPAAQAIAYAAITGLVVAAAQTFATRKAAAYYAESAGHEPPGFGSKKERKQTATA